MMVGLWERAVAHREMKQWYDKLLWVQHWNRSRWTPRSVIYTYTVGYYCNRTKRR